MNLTNFSFSATTRASTGLVDHKGTQTVVSRDIHDINQDKQSTKLLQTHALLVRFVVMTSRVVMVTSLGVLMTSRVIVMTLCGIVMTSRNDGVTSLDFG